MEKYIIRKINGESKRTSYKKELLENYNQKPHLCIECNNGCPNRCKKVADARKRNINYYEFITQGYQIISYGLNENGENEFIVDKFVVEECNNFKKDPIKTEKQNSNSRAAMTAALKMQYFETETLQEANNAELSLAKRNILRQREYNIQHNNPEWEGIDQYIPAGLKEEFYEYYNVPKKRDGKTR